MKIAKNKCSIQSVFLFINLLLLNILSCSCNDNHVLSVDTSNNQKKYLFVDSIIDLEEYSQNEELDCSDLRFFQDRLFLTNSQRDTIYSVSMDNSDKLEEVYKVDDNKSLCTIGIVENSDELQCALILSDYNSDWELEYTAILIDNTGKNYEYVLSEISSIDIAFVELNEEKEFIVFSSAGEVFVYLFNENDFSLDFKHKIEVFDAYNCLPLVVDNYIFYFGSNEENVFLYKKDVLSGKIVSSIELSMEDVYSDRLYIVNNPEDSKSIIFSDGNDVYTTDFVNVERYSNMFPSFYTVNYVADCGEGLLFDLYDCSSDSSRHVLLITHFENIDNIDSKSINIGYSNEASFQLLNVLSEEYMMFNPNVNIQLTFYDIHSLGGLEDLRKDIENNEGPMIFYLNSGDYAIVDSVFEACVIDNADILEQDEYNNSVIEAINSYGEGKIAAPFYEIVGLTIPYEASLARNEEAYTIDNFLYAASLSSYPEGVTGDFENLTKNILMNEYSLEDEEATKLINHLYEIKNLSVYHTEVFFHTCRISEFSDFYRYSTYYSDGMRVVGFPNLKDSSPLIVLDDFFILNESGDEISKDFIGFLYGSEAQRVILHSNKIPVLNSIISENKALNNSSMNSYIESTTGEDLSILEVSEPDSQIVFDSYLTLLNGLHNVMAYDSNVEAIINEEISSYIGEMQDANTTLMYIRERIELYLSVVND